MRPAASSLVARLLLAGVLLLASACAAGEEDTNTRAKGPKHCPRGFAQALVAGLNDVHAIAELEPRDVGLRKIEGQVACVIRTDSHSWGASATIIMRAGLSEDDVRHALWDAGFDDGSHSTMSRPAVHRGELKTVLRLTYGGLTDRWRGRHWRYRDDFPPETVVLDASLRVPHIRKECDAAAHQAESAGASGPMVLTTPQLTIVSCRPQTAKEIGRDIAEQLENWKPKGAHCQDVTTWDYNWQSDMLCTRADGSQFYTDYEGAAAFLGYDSAAEFGH